jgi:HD-GYP domain-containing protein (c-di-GMP phosphodiesterase class II)
MIDHIIDEESLSILLAMTTIKDYDDYTYYHSVNVSILSMSLGHKIGLPKKVLEDLGLAALVHDIGKVNIPQEMLNKTSELTENDWLSIKQHPLQGMIKLIQMKGIDETSMSLAISAFEHHINHDLSGYPDFTIETPIDLFSKIIAIADRYDAMTSSQVYSRMPKSPDEALNIMFENSNKEMDPCLLKFFVHMIGKYPVGCLVMLDSNELGVVTRNNADPEFAERPKVLIITDSSGKRIENTVVDLMEKDEEGNFRKCILKTLDPNKYFINLSEYLLLTA